jgi:hypothetical protein
MVVSDTGLPEAVEQLVLAHIDSYEELEVLLLLYAHPDRAFTDAEVAAELRTAQDSARRCLEHLARRGLAVLSGAAARFAVAGRDAAVVAQVAEQARVRRVSLITLIFSKPTDPARKLADAFRVKKKEL